MKLAIVGTRNPSVSYSEWEQLMLSHVERSEITQVISGGAKGIDTFAKQFAARHRIPFMEFSPEYSKYGRNAPIKRNIQIVEESDLVIAFPSPKSRGTHDTIKKAKALNKPLKIIELKCL